MSNEAVDRVYIKRIRDGVLMLDVNGTLKLIANSARENRLIREALLTGDVPEHAKDRRFELVTSRRYDTQQWLITYSFVITRTK